MDQNLTISTKLWKKFKKIGRYRSVYARLLSKKKNKVLPKIILEAGGGRVQIPKMDREICVITKIYVAVKSKIMCTFGAQKAFV